MYAWIGDALPGLLQYQDTLRKYPAVEKVLGDYYWDISAFHCKALDVFARSSKA